MASTIISGKPTLTYAKLQVILAQAANVVNDQPVGVKLLTEQDIIPLTPNQLLLGWTSTNKEEMLAEEVHKNYGVASRYQEELLNVWWNLWREQVFPHLLLYYQHKEAKHHINLKQGDICLLKYDNKIRGTYRLCRILEVCVSQDSIVHTVTVGFRPRKTCKGGVGYQNTKLEQKEVAVQHLFLLCPQEELPEEESKGGE